MFDLTKLHSGAEPKNGEYLTIAIDGRGGAGKTALAEFLGEALDGFTVINGDDYFEPHDDAITWGAFNEERFHDEIIRPVDLGIREFAFRPFDFHRAELGPPKHLTIDQGVIIERCYSFKFPVAWDLRVWDETPKEICMERGLQREGAKMWGERATAAWLQVWQPEEDRYLEEWAPRNLADLIVDGTQPFENMNWVLRRID